MRLAWMRTGSAVVERSTPTVALSLLNHGPEALTTTLALIALPSSMVTPVTWGRVESGSESGSGLGSGVGVGVGARLRGQGRSRPGHLGWSEGRVKLGSCSQGEVGVSRFHLGAVGRRGEGGDALVEPNVDSVAHARLVQASTRVSRWASTWVGSTASRATPSTPHRAALTDSLTVCAGPPSTSHHATLTHAPLTLFKSMRHV